MKVLGIYREKEFSPGKVKQDKAIMDLTLIELSKLGFNTEAISPDSIPKSAKADLVLNMAQSKRSLLILSEWEKKGIPVINSTVSIKNCYRKNLFKILKENGLPIPKTWIYKAKEIDPSKWKGHFWIKRGDFHALQRDDVSKVESSEEMKKALLYFIKNSIDEVIIQQHLDGNVIKFYGVDKNYIRAFLSPRNKEFDLSKDIIDVIFKAKDCLGLEIYGGDLVLSKENNFYIIDINDWPSFSLCQNEAARYIAQYINSFLP